MKSEARLSVAEGISMIVGNSIGTGIIAVPYLAKLNSIYSVVVLAVLAYFINVILHIIIAELSYNNDGLQIVKCFEQELFGEKMTRGRTILSWIIFLSYGIAIILGIIGNIDGGARIIVNWFGINFRLAQIIYYVLVGAVVFCGMKAVGIAQKFAVIGFFIIVIIMSIGTFTLDVHGFSDPPFYINNFIALYSMLIFATSANQAVIQCVKGLDGDAKKIRFTIFVGFLISTLFVLLVTVTVLIGTSGSIDKQMAYMELGRSIGPIFFVFAGLFSLFALVTTFWSQTLTLRDIVSEQTRLSYRLAWLVATIPCILIALLRLGSFILLTRLMSGVVVILSIMLIITYSKSRKRVNSSNIAGIFGTKIFCVILILSTVIASVGSVVKLTM